MEATALRMPYKELQKEFLENKELNDSVLQCVQSQGSILGQLAACNRLHEAEGRLARWLLMVRDRVDSETYLLTQEFLANMLGARRTTVTAAAGTLQRKGLIKYSRGRIRIVDAEGLESSACECYKTVRKLHLNFYGETKAA
jgi:CRP-like cAMP-binding protein